MNSIEILKKIVENKTIGILCAGVSLSKLEENIEKFRNKDIVWLGFNYGETYEKYILSKINRYLDVTCDFSINAHWKELKDYEEKVRIPYLIESINKDIYTITGRGLIENLYKDLDLSNFYNTYKDKLHFLEDLHAEAEHQCNSSIGEILGFLLRCNPKRIILFGFDGYRSYSHPGNILRYYYRGQELYDIYPKNFPTGSKVAQLGGDCSVFENICIDFFNDVCKIYNTKLPEILNCSEVSIYTKLKKISYEELENIIEDKTMITKQELIDFEKDIASLYEQGKIRSPIHLDASKDESLEDWLIKFFQDNHIDKNTWIFSTHRNHLPWLLSGRSSEELKKQIIEGHSMHIFGYKFFTSAIVGGVAPIALGVAKAITMKASNEKVYCFIGDMAASGGLVHECIQYAEGWDLPITYVILDNQFSVRANTNHTWGVREGKNKVYSFKYERIYNHAGPFKQGESKYVMF